MKVKFMAVAIMIAVMALTAACGQANKTTTTTSTAETKKEVTVENVIQAFKNAGLEAENTYEMGAKDYGMAPMTAKKGIRFLIPSMGVSDDVEPDDKDKGMSGGRVLVFENQEKMEAMKKYYDSLKEVSAWMFSWTVGNKTVLVQINGELSEDQFNKYKAIIDSLDV
jgi:hypothetical protein